MVRRWHGLYPDARLQFTPAAHPVMAKVDVYQLERVLDNLLGNARQAAGGWAEIQVRDSGPGFSPEAREHLFEPFHTTKRGGSGLGLASCLTIVQAHGGEIAVAEGPSSEIRVRLPAA